MSERVGHSEVSEGGYKNRVTEIPGSGLPGSRKFEIGFSDKRKMMVADAHDGSVNVVFLDHRDRPSRAGIIVPKDIWGEAEEVVSRIDRIQDATGLEGGGLPEVIETAVNAKLRYNAIFSK